MDEANPPLPPSFKDEWRPTPNKKAGIALGLGIVAFLCMPLLTVLFGPAALATGYVARREIDGDPGRYTNRGMATAGMVLATLACIITIAFYVYRGTR